MLGRQIILVKPPMLELLSLTIFPVLERPLLAPKIAVPILKFGLLTTTP